MKTFTTTFSNEKGNLFLIITTQIDVLDKISIFIKVTDMNQNPVTLYKGSNLSEAIDIFNENNL